MTKCGKNAVHDRQTSSEGCESESSRVDEFVRCFEAPFSECFSVLRRALYIPMPPIERLTFPTPFAVRP